MKQYIAALCLLSYISMHAHPIADYGPGSAPIQEPQNQAEHGIRAGCLVIADEVISRRYTIPQTEREKKEIKKAKLAALAAEQQQKQK